MIINGENIMDQIIKWHKDLSESVRKKLGMSHYAIYWVSFFKGILFILLVLALVGCSTSAKANDIAIPKYFFANELTKETCSLEGVHGYGSWGKTHWEMDLAITHVSKSKNPELQGNNYDHLMKLTEYDWNKDHELRSNSIYVNHEKHTNRLALLHGTIVYAIVNNKMEEHGPIIAEVRVAWAEAGVMLSTLTSEEIRKLKDQGKVDNLCYGNGKGDGSKPCISHRPHEAQIFGATYMQQAYLMKDQFTEEQFKIVDEYIETLYKKYVKPMAISSLKLNKHTRGFIQLADGTIGILSYLAWKDKPEQIVKWIEKGIAKADHVLYKDGYIHNNSFRGVRDVWYHSQGVNNLLGLYAIAELWGYKQFPKDLKKRIDKSVDILNLGLTDVKTYRKRKDPSGMKNHTKDKSHSAYHVHQMAISLDWLIENYTDRDHTIVADDGMWKSKKSAYFVDRNFGFEPKCMN
jgi:ribosomal protein L25 (general stress protein Ctc)